MLSDHELRLRFRGWLVEQALEPEIADAILETMPPFNWSEIARRGEIAEQFSEVNAQFTRVDDRFTGVDARFDKIDTRLDTLTVRVDELNTSFQALAGTMANGSIAINQRIDTLSAHVQTMSRAVAVGAVSVTLSLFLAIVSMVIVVSNNGVLG
jgi:outer membrane murein-binding lipoprotein Lpp